MDFKVNVTLIFQGALTAFMELHVIRSAKGHAIQVDVISQLEGVSNVQETSHHQNARVSYV